MKRVKKHERIEKKKLQESTKWDRKSTIMTCLLILLLAICVLCLNIDFRGYYIKNSASWESTCGRITSINAIEMVEQTRVGAKWVVESYRIEYTYEINEQIYSGLVYLSSASAKNKKFIQKIKEGAFWSVFYRNDKPEKSYLNTDLDAYCSKHAEH